MTRRERRDPVAGIVIGGILVFVGGFYLLTNTFGFNLNWDAVWPVAVIIVGAAVIYGGFERSHDERRTPRNRTPERR